MKLRNVIGMLLLVALLVGGLWAADTFKTTVGPRIPVSLLNPFDKRDVSRVEFSAQGDEVVLRRRSEGDDLWDVKLGDGFVRANDVIVDELLSALVQADVTEAFPGDDVADSKRAEWGLMEPAAEVSITLPGEVRTGRFGALSREGGRIYADRGPGTDVLIVSAAPYDEIVSAISQSQGVRDPRLTDLRTYDVKKVTILRGGVATFEAEKDVAQIWKIRQPFAGYAEPTKMETRVSHLVNEKWRYVVMDGVQDLSQYGLDPPVAEITLVSKRDQVRELLLGDAIPEDEGLRYAMERGVPTVYAVSARLGDAVLADAVDVRDQSFTRLGFDGLSLTVDLGTADTRYRLAKVHTDWEIERPTRFPADGARVEAVLTVLREWHTAGFHDQMSPADAEISEDGWQVQIGTQGGGDVTLLIGRELSVDGGRRYLAQRRGDGGVEEVLAGPIEALQDGWLQFRRRTVAEWAVEDIEFIGIAPGTSEAGSAVEESSWRRELQANDKSWKMGVGQTGGLDPARMNALLESLRTIRADEWLHWDAGENDRMGFSMDGSSAATLRLEVGFAEHLSPPQGGRTQILLIGSPHPDGGYYARLKTNVAGTWAFRLPETAAEALTAPLTQKR